MKPFDVMLANQPFSRLCYPDGRGHLATVNGPEQLC